MSEATPFSLTQSSLSQTTDKKTATVEFLRGNESSKMKKAGSKKQKILKKMNLQTGLDTKTKQSFSEKKKKKKKKARYRSFSFIGEYVEIGNVIKIVL